MRYIIPILLTLIISCSVNEPVATHGIALSKSFPMITHNDTIAIFMESHKAAKTAAGPATTKVIFGLDSLPYSIVNVAVIPPVIVNGHPVHANDIVVDGSGNKAFIAYNYAGTLFAGAVQALDISKKGQPSVLWEIQFPGMDINGVHVDGNALLISGAADPDQWDIRSFIARIDNVVSPDINSIVSSVKGLRSYAAVGTTTHGLQVFTGVGALNGCIEILDKTTLDYLDTLQVEDVRDVESYQSGIIALSGTTDNSQPNGRVLIYNSAELHKPSVISIDGFGSDYHKATIEVYDGTQALLALSEAGFKVLDLASSKIIFTLANPVFESRLTNTNSVSTDGNFIVTANGEYGFRVFRPTNKTFTEIESSGYYRTSIEPSVNPDSTYSANHIEMKSGYLFVAAGAAGVHVYTFVNN
jgi:hypothetical protein